MIEEVVKIEAAAPVKLTQKQIREEFEKLDKNLDDLYDERAKHEKSSKEYETIDTQMEEIRLKIGILRDQCSHPHNHNGGNQCWYCDDCNEMVCMT